MSQSSELSGQPFTAVAEFNLLDATGAVVDRSRWKVSADSADGTAAGDDDDADSAGPLALAIDVAAEPAVESDPVAAAPA